MDTWDWLGIAALAAGIAAFWHWGLRQRGRLAAPLRQKNLAAMAAALGPRLKPGEAPPASGNWHRVLQESHRAANQGDYGWVVLFSEAVVVDQDGRHWHVRVRCDQRRPPEGLQLTPLACASDAASATFTARWNA